MIIIMIPCSPRSSPTFLKCICIDRRRSSHRCVLIPCSPRSSPQHRIVLRPSPSRIQMQEQVVVDIQRRHENCCSVFEAYYSPGLAYIYMHMEVRFRHINMVIAHKFLALTFSFRHLTLVPQESYANIHADVLSVTNICHTRQYRYVSVMQVANNQSRLVR